MMKISSVIKLLYSSKQHQLRVIVHYLLFPTSKLNHSGLEKQIVVELKLVMQSINMVNLSNKAYNIRPT